MEKVELGKSGLKVTRLGIGAWQAGGKQWGEDVRDEDCMAALVRAHELGVNLVDTAEVYGGGHSEEVVGRAIKKIGRDEIVVATKVAGSHLGGDEVTKACEMSIKRLGVDMIDLYQIHWPSVWEQVPLRETMKSLEKLFDNGKIGAIGVSNFSVRDMEEARGALSKTDIVSNQVQYSMIHREIEKEILPYCQKEKIAILAWAPLGEGALTGKYSEDHAPKDSVRERHRFFMPENIAAINRLVKMNEEIGKSHGKSALQVALNWLMTNEPVLPIPGAKNPKQAEQNVGSSGWRLTSKELSRIEKELTSLRIKAF